MEDIAKEIDDIIRNIYNKIDLMIEISQNEKKNESENNNSDDNKEVLETPKNETINESENNDIKSDINKESLKNKMIVGDNVIAAFKKLIHEWFSNNQNKMKYFSFISTHISEIYFKILNEEFSDVKKKWMSS